MRIRTLVFASALPVAILAGCQSVETTQAGAVGVDRKQMMAVSTEEVHDGSVKAYSQMMAEAQKKGVLDRDPAVVKRVRDITNRLIPHSTVFRPDAAKWPWQCHTMG